MKAHALFASWDFVVEKLGFHTALFSMTESAAHVLTWGQKGRTNIKKKNKQTKKHLLPKIYHKVEILM